jgi:hypothetical protein
MIQSETERQFYLGIAGVRVWYARDALPGASPSHGYALQGSEEDADVGLLRFQPRKLTKRIHLGAGGHPGSAGRNIDAALAKPNLKALMDPGSEHHARAEPAPSVAIANVDDAFDDISITAPEETISVNLGVQVWMGKRFAMIARLSSEVSAGLQETLALNILRSLNESSPQTLGAVHWPVFNNSLVPGNSIADFGKVLEYVMSALEDQTLVNLGVDIDIIRNALETGKSLDNLKQIIFPYSLAEMAANTSLKRELWHQIKPVTVS